MYQWWLGSGFLSPFANSIDLVALSEKVAFVNQFEIIYLEFELPCDLVGVFLGTLGLFNYS